MDRFKFWIRAFAFQDAKTGGVYWRHLSCFNKWRKRCLCKIAAKSVALLWISTVVLPALDFLKKITIGRTVFQLLSSTCATRTTRRFIWVIYLWSTSGFLGCLITNIGTFCFRHLTHFSQKSSSSIWTMSAKKRPLTALSTAETAAAVKMIIVPSNQTLPVSSSIRVITPTSGQAPGQAMIVGKPMTIQHTLSETGQTAVHANKTATKSPSGGGTITILSQMPSSGKTTGAVRMICNVEKCEEGQSDYSSR